MSKNIYEPKKYSPSEINDAVRSRRDSKEKASEIDVRGRKSTELKDEINQAQEIIDTMEFIHRDWLDKKIQQIIPYFIESNTKFSSLTKSEILEEIRIPFTEGLHSAITQEKRLKDNLPLIKSELEDIIVSYFFDFFRSLRVSQRLDVSPVAALKIAKLSFRNNPDIIINLSKKYQDLLPESIIFNAVYNNPLDPEEFLKSSVRKIEELKSIYPQEKYPEVTLTIIQRAVFIYSNPEKFINKFIEVFKYIKNQYPNISETTISRIYVINPNNPIEEIRILEIKIEELKKIFNFPTYIIEGAVVGYSNPKEFLDNLTISTDKLRKEFPELTLTAIQHAAYRYPSNPSGFIIEFKKRREELKMEFPNIPSNIIEKTALSYPVNARTYLLNYLREQKN